MKPVYKKILKTTLFITIGVVLFYLVYKDYNTEKLFNEIKNMNYWWIFPMFLVSLLSHISRSVRWQMMLKSDGSKVRFHNTFLAVLNAYFANLAVPRLGEVTRCAIVSRYEKQNFSKVLGTMFSERLTDVFVLGVFTVLAFILQTGEIKDFISNNPDLGVQFKRFTSWQWLAAYIVMAVLSLIFLIRLLKGKYDHISIFKKLADFIRNFWNGIISIKNVKKPFWYWFHSFFIFSMYFLVLYFCFFAVDGLEGINIYSALLVFVAGSFGMVAPAPNGIGAYHFMTIQALLIYNIADEKAAAFALIAHGIQTMFIVFAGFISFILLPILNKEKV